MDDDAYDHPRRRAHVGYRCPGRGATLAAQTPRFGPKTQIRVEGHGPAPYRSTCRFYDCDMGVGHLTEPLLQPLGPRPSRPGNRNNGHRCEGGPDPGPYAIDLPSLSHVLPQ